MMRISRLVLVPAVLLLGACKDKTQSSAPAADAPPPQPTTGIGRAPAVAQQGVDSSNAAANRRAAEIDSIATAQP